MDLTEGFRIGDWDVLPLEGRIVPRVGGEPVRVRRKAMDVLCALAEGGGQVVERDALLSAVWGPTAVTDEPLTSTIGELRRLLGERQGEERRYIETIPKRGYRLLVEVEAPGEGAAEPDCAGVEEAAGADAAVAAPESVVAAETMAPSEESRSGRRSRTRPEGRLRPVIRLDWKTLIAMVLVLAAIPFAVQQFLASAVVPVPERSIAVLPFDDLSPAGDQAYFAEGLAEELISLLTRTSPLRVAARNSAFSFRDQSLATRQVAERLRVAHVLTGSVRRMGERVRVTAQLVDAREDYQLWSETYDRTLDDIFAIQEEIAHEVTRELSLTLLGGAARVRETDTRAYTFYLQARHVGNQLTKDGLEQAAELYRRALAIDPEYLPAWEELAGVYANMAGFVLIPRDEGFALSQEAIFKALAIDPDFAPAHGRLGWLAMYEHNDLAAAAEHYRRALSLEPGNIDLRGDAAVLAAALGRMDDAIALLKDVLARDPVSAVSHANLANAYLLSRRYEDAERSIRSALTLSPQYAGAHYRLGRMRLAQGDLEEARAAFAAEPLEAGQLLGRAMLGNVEGDIEASEAALDALKALYGDVAAGNYAQIYAHRGDVEKAFEWLEAEYAISGAGGFLEHRWDPMFDSLRDDPRWPEFLERIGYGDALIQAVAFPSLEELGIASTP